MRKPQLIELSKRVSEIAETDKLIIVGSQSLYALTNDVPEIVKKSVECDYLLINIKTENFRKVITEIGFASEFQEQNGYFADVLGLATVVLTNGWQERLVLLNDENDKVVAYCLEIHDLAISKSAILGMVQHLYFQ